MKKIIISGKWLVEAVERKAIKIGREDKIVLFASNADLMRNDREVKPIPYLTRLNLVVSKFWGQTTLLPDSVVPSEDTIWEAAGFDEYVAMQLHTYAFNIAQAMGNPKLGHTPVQDLIEVGMFATAYEPDDLVGEATYVESLNGAFGELGFRFYPGVEDLFPMSMEAINEMLEKG